MGRINGSSNLVDQQPPHQIQLESNPPTEVEYHQNQQQTTAFSAANAQTTAFSAANAQTTAFSPANLQPTTSFSPANAQPTTAFYQPNVQPTTAFCQATTQPMAAFFPPNNAQHFHSCQPPIYGVNQPSTAAQHQATQPTGEAIVPTVGIPVQMGNGLWTTGLFDCLDDPLNALVTTFLPCVTYGQIAEIIDHGQSWLTCLISCSTRTKMRNQYGLVEAPAPDWIVHLCCESCALCQEYRELQKRGIDPSIGWAENMGRRQVAVMAPPNQRMMGR